MRLRAWLAARGHRADAIVSMLLVVAFAEYLVQPLKLTPVPTRPPPAYQWLRGQPEGVVAEFPMPTKSTLPLHEGEFQFLSTFHWRPIVNGYSGNWSIRWVRFLDQVKGFPDDDSIAALRAAGVTYVLVHERYFGQERYRQVLEQLRGQSDVEQAGDFDDDEFEIAVYRLTA